MTLSTEFPHTPHIHIPHTRPVCCSTYSHFMAVIWNLMKQSIIYAWDRELYFYFIAMEFNWINIFELNKQNKQNWKVTAEGISYFGRDRITVTRIVVGESNQKWTSTFRILQRLHLIDDKKLCQREQRLLHSLFVYSFMFLLLYLGR